MIGNRDKIAMISRNIKRMVRFVHRVQRNELEFEDAGVSTV
jgi:hypothetical protein